MAYPMPTAGQYNTPWFQTFLSNHPGLRDAAAKGNLNGFLDKHPDIAQRYTALFTAGQKPAAPVAPPAPAQPGVTPAATADPAQASARATITQALDAYGLGSLGTWAWQQYINGTPTEQIMLDLRERPEYAQRFPGMAELSKKGRAVSEAEYISLERSYAQQARAYGLPEGFYDDPTDFGKLISGEVSAQEFGDRLQMAQQAALSSPQGQQLRDELSRLYGISGSVGAVTAYWIDPDRSATLIKQQFAASQVAAEAAATGFGSLTKDQAELVGGTGISAEQARSGFTQLAGLHELNTGLAGDAGSQGVSQDDMVRAAFTGDAAAGERLQKEQRRRTAVFDGGGGYAAGQRGVTGLGSAAT